MSDASRVPDWAVDGPRGKTAHLMSDAGRSRCGHVFTHDPVEAVTRTKTCQRCIKAGTLTGHPAMAQRPDRRGGA